MHVHTNILIYIGGGAAQYLYFIYIGKTKRVYVCVQENLKEKKGCLDGVAMRHIGKLLHKRRETCSTEMHPTNQMQTKKRKKEIRRRIEAKDN